MARTPKDRRSLFGDAVLLAFLAAQFFDGAFTYIGVHHFGLGIEANPIVGWYIAALGIGYALIVTKALAVGCAAVLHLFARHRMIGVLTILYAQAAGRTVVVDPARCKQCGFVFGDDRLAKPSKCPECKGTRLYEAQISIQPPRA